MNWPSFALGFSVGGLVCFVIGWWLGRAERSTQ